MKCPRTGSELKKTILGGITVEISTESGGVFFDRFEIEKFDESHEIRGDVLAEHLEQFWTTPLNNAERINCPQCTDVVMMRRYYSPQEILEIDECPNCAGIWLDAGELEQLRRIFISDHERALLTEKLIKEVAKHPDVLTYEIEQREINKRMKNFSEILWKILGVVRDNV